MTKSVVEEDRGSEDEAEDDEGKEEGSEDISDLVDPDGGLVDNGLEVL